MANWNLIDKAGSVYPACIPLTMEGFQNIVFHKSLVGIKNLEKDIKRAFYYEILSGKKNTGYDKAGSVKLPGAIVGRVLGRWEISREGLCFIKSLWTPGFDNFEAAKTSRNFSFEDFKSLCLDCWGFFGCCL